MTTKHKASSSAAWRREGVRVLLLPGWLDSGPGHWQTQWQQRHGFERVEQDDWEWPKRGDWMARLESVVRDTPDGTSVALVAHSLGCALVAAWAAHSTQTARVRAALLVAPPDLDREDLALPLRPWRPMVRRTLPFAARVVASRDDPFGEAAQATALAQCWGAGFVGIGARGHINAESGLGDWDEGLAMLEELLTSPR
jgi:uncharacterized protein